MPRNIDDEIQRAIELARHRARAGHVVVLVIPVSEDVSVSDEEFDKPWKGDFLKWMRKGRSVTVAAELSGVTPRHAHRTYHKDPVFARAWDALKKSHSQVPDVPPDHDEMGLS